MSRVTTIDLNGDWDVRAHHAAGKMPKQAAAANRWMNASVPGVIHTDLMNAGVIPDPFYRKNEDEVQWVADVPWIYRRRFQVPAELMNERHIELVADGLDTFARISINGRPVGASWNMFTVGRFDVRRALRAGKNVLEVVFDSPVSRAKALERRHGRLQVELEPHRVHIRKAQYSFGWDWGPRLTTSGIWRPLRIEAYSHARLRDPFVRVKRVRPDSATLLISCRVEHRSRVPLFLQIRVRGHGAHSDTTIPVTVPSVEAQVTLGKVRLWWPHGYGDQPMYTADLTLREEDREIDSAIVPFAVRTVRLLQKADTEGRSFIVEVNGERIFCKGADWIPADSFLPRVTRFAYERLLTLARDASMNMIRVWGGGVYEDDAFYDACDRLGLMVWQDFMYACAEYPDHPEFLHEARREAAQIVTRLRNHPSIVLWCGNNECEWIFCTRNPGKGPDQMRGAPIFRDVLPGVVQRLDGTRPYWRSTPFGRGFPNAETDGNHHQWEVWSGWKDFRAYERINARFVTEFGFQGPANRSTMEGVLVPEDYSPLSPVMEHHNKMVEGTERLFRFLAGHFTVPTRWMDFFHKGQLLQGEALKCAVEHWRRRKFRTAGALLWQLNDCWPVTSWAVVDSSLRPKAAYYFAKRFFAPVLISLVRKDRQVEIWGTNDELAAVRGRLQVALLSLAGRVHWRREYAVRIPANSSRVLRIVPDLAAIGGDSHSTYVRAEFRSGRRTPVVNRLFFVEPKHLALTKPEIRLTVNQERREGGTIVLTSPTLALGVELASRDNGVEFEDNFVTVDPGISARVGFRNIGIRGVRRKNIVLRALTP